MADIYTKIKALRDKIPENGATEEEAMVALKMAQKLMEKHGIDEAMLKRRDFSEILGKAEFTQKQKQIHPASKFCGAQIERFCGIIVWQSYDHNRKKTLKLFGYHQDVEMAHYLLTIIKSAMDRDWKEYIRKHPKTGKSRHTEYWSFMAGFGDRINDKLRELSIEIEMSIGTDLFSTKRAVVEEGLSSMLPSLKLRVSNSSQNLQAAAYGKGQIAGDRVDLSRPIAEKTTGGRMLS